jgi:hypothetical protein
MPSKPDTEPASPPEPRLWKALWPRQKPWQEFANTRMIAARGLTKTFGPGAWSQESVATIESHLEAAEQAITGEGIGRLARWRLWIRGAGIERATSNLDLADVFLLRIAPESYVIGRLPALYAKVRSHLRAGDPQLSTLAELVKRYKVEPPPALALADRETIAAVYDAGCAEGRREITRLRDFRNVLLATAVMLWLAVGGGHVGDGGLPHAHSHVLLAGRDRGLPAALRAASSEPVPDGGSVDRGGQSGSGHRYDGLAES